MRYKANTLDPIESPVTCYDLSVWVRGESNDPIYSTLLTSATSQVIEFLQRDLITRDWTLNYQDWPVENYSSDKALFSDAKYISRIPLPYTNLISVESVYVNDELTTDYNTIDLLPAELCFDSISINTDCSYPSLKVNYKAGFGTVDDVPQPIKDGILMVAGYMYNNRGCGADDAIKSSGAERLLTPYAIQAGVVL